VILTSIDTVRGISGGLRIGTGEGDGYDAIIVQTDTADGLVLLRAIGAQGLKPLELATGAPNPGDAAIIVTVPGLGGPYVASASVASLNGNVLTLSATHRADEIGSPVVDGSGNVIGIVQTASGIAGETTASNTTNAGAAALVASHPVLSSNALGLTSTLLSTSAAAALKTVPGAFVQGVAPGGPAARAGIEIGDTITKVNGVAIDSGHPLDPNTLHLTAGAQAQFDVVRAGAHLSLTLTVGS
jgi:S1-C subfamily serine protease